MINTKVVYGEPIDIFIPLENIKFEELQIVSSLNIYSNNEQILLLNNGKGFSINKINETGEVFIDIAIGDTKEFFSVGSYTWDLQINLLNGKTYKVFTGKIDILDGQYKDRERVVKPWDLLNDNRPRVSKEIKNERFNVCKSCPELALGICKKCGCVMGLKTMLAQAKCPIGKWDAINID